MHTRCCCWPAARRRSHHDCLPCFPPSIQPESHAARRLGACMPCLTLYLPPHCTALHAFPCCCPPSDSRGEPPGLMPIGMRHAHSHAPALHENSSYMLGSLCLTQLEAPPHPLEQAPPPPPSHTSPPPARCAAPCVCRLRPLRLPPVPRSEPCVHSMLSSPTRLMQRSIHSSLVHTTVAPDAARSRGVEYRQ